jgi:phosphate starvation-inducible PhoH-like protein
MRNLKKKSKMFSNSLDVFNNFKEPEFLSEIQYHSFSEFNRGKNLVISGYAGTGKSFISCLFALDLLKKRSIDQVQIIRSATQARDIGHLPGTLQEKLMVYEKPYEQIFNEILHRDDAYCLLKQKGMVKFESTSFLRGLTYDNSLVILDEAQNANYAELYSVITRIGENSRIIIVGDGSGNQCDLNLRHEFSGFLKIVEVCEKIPKHFSIIEMGVEDIVRSEFVKDFIIASSSS